GRGQVLHRVEHLLGGAGRYDAGTDGAAVLGLGQLANGESEHFGQAAARIADLLLQRDPPSSTSRRRAARTGSRPGAGAEACGAGACAGGGGGASARAAAAAPRTVASSSAASLPARSSTPSATDNAAARLRTAGVVSRAAFSSATRARAGMAASAARA